MSLRALGGGRTEDAPRQSRRSSMTSREIVGFWGVSLRAGLCTPYAAGLRRRAGIRFHPLRIPGMAQYNSVCTLSVFRIDNSSLKMYRFSIY